MNFFKTKLTLKLEEVEEQCKKDKISLLDGLDKLIPKDPIKGDVVYFKGYLMQEYKCQICERTIGDEQFMFNYCPNCGTKINKEGVPL